MPWRTCTTSPWTSWSAGSVRPRGGRPAPDPVPLRGPTAALGLPGLPGPDPGDFLYAQKVTKKALGRPQTPFFVQSDTCKGDTQLPLRRRGASGSLVIGAVSISLRLSPLGLRVGFVMGASRRSPTAAFQWLRRIAFILTDWTTAGVQPEGGWRLFGSLLGGQKWTRRRQTA